MDILLKVWYKGYSNKFKNYMTYKLILDKNEREFLIKCINNNDMEEVKPLIKKNLNIPINKLIGVNCLNGCIDILEKNITVLSEIYVTDNYLRKLKILKLLSDGG